MKKFLISVIFSIFLISPVYAGCNDIGTSSVPESINIQLKQKCLDLQASAAATPPVTVDQLSEYADLGKKYGVALSEVAKSVGTTVNDLAQTPVGEFMLVLVAYKVIGRDIMQFVGSFFWFITIIPLWIYMLNRLILKNRYSNFVYDEKGKIQSKEVRPISYDGSMGVLLSWMIVILIIGCLTGILIAFA